VAVHSPGVVPTSAASLGFGERVARCIAGLGLFGAGIAVIVDARLGLPPWDVFHQGLSSRTGLGLGTVIIVVGALLLIVWIPLRQRPGLGTLLNTLEIGLVVNALDGVVPSPDALAARAAMLLAGIVAIALGSALYIGSGLGAGPRDGLMMGLHRLGLSVRAARTIIEIGVLALGWLLGGSVGVGTVAFAVGIGPLVHLLLPRFTVTARPRGS
jgi:uncharacterized membrane protein YczE